MKIKKILAVFTLMVTSLVLFLHPEKATALFSECTSGQFCFNADVAHLGDAAFNPTSITSVPNADIQYKINIFNWTSTTRNNVTVRDLLPTGVTFNPTNFKANNYPGSVNTSQLLSSSGFNFGSFPPGYWVEIYVQAKVDSYFIPGLQTLINQPQISTDGGGFSGSNTANVVVDFIDFPADSGLNGYYYNSKYITGSPTFSRVDGVVDSTQLSWPLLSGPGGGLGDDNFSVKWEGQVKSECTGPITIKTNSDDGIRVFLNNTLIIDKWFDRAQPVPLDQGVVNLTAGAWNNIRVDYYEHGGGSIAQLYWNSACQTGSVDEIIPQQNLRQTYTGSVNYGLTGDYFNNENVTGSPVLTRVDLGVNFNFDLGAPGAGVNTDHFSTKWTGRLTTDYSESYQFCVTSDDGSRLWIDDVNVIEEWTAHGMTEFCGSIALSAGTHNIRLDYFDQHVDAAVNLKWSSTSQTGGVKEFIPLSKLSPTGYTGADFGLTGEYFNNTTFTGLPVLTRNDGPISFDWGLGSPDGAVNSNLFSAKWTGTLKALEAGNHNFIFYSDDGVKLIIDGVTRIDQLVNQSLTRNESGNIALSAGDHTIEIQYFDQAESAGIFFLYTTPSNATERTVPMSVLLN